MRHRSVVFAGALILVVGGSDLFAQYGGTLPVFPTGVTTNGGAASVVYGTNLSQAQWLGGDGGTAFPLDSVSAFWAFSDTFIGLPNQNFVNPNVRVGNTIAIASSLNGVFKPTYIFRGTATNPLPFFMDPLNPNPNPTPGAPGYRFWTLKPFTDTYNPTHTLYVFLHRIQDNPDLSFKIYDTLIARVTNPTAGPTNWKIDLLSLTQSNGAPLSAFYGDDAFIFGGYVFAYGQYAPPNGSFRTVAIRIPMTTLSGAPTGNSYIGNAVEYYSQTGNWVATNAGLVGTDAYDVGIPSTSGFSARFHQPLNKWQVVYIRSNPGFNPPLGTAVMAMTSGSPFGPWGTPVAIWNIPYPYATHVYSASEKYEYATNPNNRILFTISGYGSYDVQAVEVANPFYSFQASPSVPNADDPGVIVYKKKGPKSLLARKPSASRRSPLPIQPSELPLPISNQFILSPPLGSPPQEETRLKIAATPAPK